MIAISLAALALASLEANASAGLQWESGPGYRSAPLSVPGEGRTGFTRVAGSLSGINFTNVLSKESGARSQFRLAGSGVAAGDVDGDGWCDLYFCGMEDGNRLYRNLGNWRFEDITDQAGVRCKGQFSTGTTLADVDGDGDLDLLVNSIGGGTRLFLNDGTGHFHEVSDRGLARKFGASSMALADVDGNGTLDLYVVNYNTTALGDEPSTRFTLQAVDGKHVVTAVDGKPIVGTDLMGRYTVSPFDKAIREFGEADILYLNDGTGHFNQISWTGGAFQDEEGKTLSAPPRDWGLSAMFHDLNENGAPGIYVCNDFFTPDRIWLNDGHGHFRAMPATDVRNSSAFSMSVDFADLNRDGHDDFFVTDMLSPDHRQRIMQAPHMNPVVIRSGEKNERTQLKRNVLQLNRGDGTYAEIAQLSGLEASAWSWATLFLDVDLDGFEDVLVAAGYDRDSMNGDVNLEIDRRRSKGNLSREALRNLGLLYPPVFSPILAFRNLGDLHFKEMGREWGFDWVGVNQGICAADLDNDGDLELIVNNLHEQAGVYRNETVRPRVAVRLKGAGANTRGIGSRIWLYGGAVPAQTQEMISGGRYLSCDDALRVFAAGSLTNAMRLEVRWRSGKRSVVDGVRANRVYEVEEAGAVGLWEARPQAPKPIFEDVSHLLKHVHHEEAYDDFVRQPLLPRKLSQLGPGVSWTDLDGDGRDDLIIGSGKGGKLGVFLNQGKGQFEPLPTGQLLGRAQDDQTTVLGWTRGDGASGMLVGESNYENGGTNGVRRYEFWPGGIQQNQVLATGLPSIGPLALGDLDGNGSLVLFAGGRARAGRWPEATSSKLYRLTGGKYAPAMEESKLLENVGLVSGAVWTDLDGDGKPELVLACEWGPLKVFRGEKGKLREVTQEWGLDRYVGWWNGIAIGDFNGDGKMDIVASNWGRNSKYEKALQAGHPLRIYYGDWDANGTLQLLEGAQDQPLQKVVPWSGLNTVARAMPWVRDRYPTHAAFSVAGLEEILGDHLKQAHLLEAGWLETTVFLNQGGRFEAVILPGEAQFAPAFGVSVADMDGDGNEDIFLSQGFFEVDEETSRYDAGRGVWLRGNGAGGFTVVPGQVSGVKVYGEGRGSALCDYDADGRVDLAVGQNSAETKLFHNVGAKPGLRVKLAGPVGNPTAVGAVIRLRFGERWGPAREIHAGSGFWSQDSAVQVLGMPERPSAVWVRWPGGKTTTSVLAEIIRGVVINSDGQLTPE